VEREGKDLRLSAREAELIEYLAERPGEIVSREELLEEVWGYSATVVTRAVHYTMVRLRKKVEADPSSPVHLFTVHGRGYRFLPDAGNAPKPAESAAVAPSVSAPQQSNLPTRVDSFVGRVDDLQTIEECLTTQEARLVTLLGAGGTGKTRLATEYGDRALSTYAGGVWFCDLTEAHSLEGLMTAVALALGVPLTDKNPSTQLGEAIAGRGPVLLILDNVEQIVEFAAETVGAWLQRAPKARFLVTSRRRLSIGGEHVVYLDPLPAEEGVRLFADRAMAAKAGFQLDDSNRAAITEIVERLDGMSLAIELAAARLRILSPDALLQRLSQRFKLLSGSRRDQSERQASLSGAIDWSWNLLEPWEQLAFAQCSVFHGSFTLDAAEAVLDLESMEDAPWPMDAVETLVDHSLLRVVEPRAGHERYQMYVSIHAYAAEKLATNSELGTGGDLRARLRARHGRHYADYGSDAYRANLRTHWATERGWALRFDFENLLAAISGGLESGDLEAAARCALAVSEDLVQRGSYAVGIDRLEQVLAKFGDAADTSPLRGPLHGGLGKLYARRGELDTAKAQFTEEVACARACADPLAEAKALNNLAIVVNYRGQITEALGYLDVALKLTRDSANKHAESAKKRAESVCLCNLGTVYQDGGRLEEARAAYTAGLALARALGDHRLRGAILGNLGLASAPKEAANYHRQALALSREVGNRRHEGIVLGNLGSSEEQVGRLDKARADYEEALSIHREVGNRHSQTIVLGSLGRLDATEGKTTVAQQRFEKGLTIAKEVGNTREEARLLEDLGGLYLSRGELEQAAEVLEEVVAKHSQFPLSAGRAMGSLSVVRAQQDRLDEARDLLSRGQELLEGNSIRQLAYLQCRRGQVEYQAGELEAAAAALSAAQQIAEEVGESPKSTLGLRIAALQALLEG